MLAGCKMVDIFLHGAMASTSMATPQFEIVPNHMPGQVFSAWSRVVAERSYRSERRYMRGPGPKTLAMIGRRYRLRLQRRQSTR
jgi:hypothetical protein